MSNRFDHDSSDPIDPALADMLTEAMSNRHHQLRNSQGSMHDVRVRARRITRRRTAVGAGALVAVGAVGAIAVATRNGDGGGRRFVTGANGESIDAAGAAGPDGGYWECTGPLGTVDAPTVVFGQETYATLMSIVGVDTVIPNPAPTATPGFESPSFSVTTAMPHDESVAFSTTLPAATSTTSPIDSTSTTIDLSASTSTTDPGLSTATSYLSPMPYPGRDGGVYYMRDCIYVDGAIPADTAATADTYPSGVEPVAPPDGGTLYIDTVVADTLDVPAVSDPNVHTSTVQPTESAVDDTAAPSG